MACCSESLFRIPTCTQPAPGLQVRKAVKASQGFSFQASSLNGAPGSHTPFWKHLLGQHEPRVHGSCFSATPVMSVSSGKERNRTRSRAHPAPSPFCHGGSRQSAYSHWSTRNTSRSCSAGQGGKKRQMQAWRSPTLGWGQGRGPTPNQPLLTSVGSPGTTPLPRLTQILLPGPACQERTVLPAILCSKACLVGAPGGRMAPEESVTRRPIPSLDATLHPGGHEGYRAARGEAGTCRGNNPEDSPKERPRPRPG